MARGLDQLVTYVEWLLRLVGIDPDVGYAAPTVTTTFTAATTAGTVAAGAREISFLASGGDVLIDTGAGDQTLPDGVSLVYVAERGETLPAIDYDPDGNTVLVSVTRVT